MSLEQTLSTDIVAAMRAKDATRLTALRMLKTALTNKSIEKGRALEAAEELQVVSMLVKQRRDSIDQFTKGGRADLADKEQAEIAVPDTVVGDQVMAAVVLREDAEFDGDAFGDFLVAQPDLGTKSAPRYLPAQPRPAAGPHLQGAQARTHRTAVELRRPGVGAHRRQPALPAARHRRGAAPGTCAAPQVTRCGRLRFGSRGWLRYGLVTVGRDRGSRGGCAPRA
jgi:hypothetical protein